MADDWKPGDLALCVRRGEGTGDPTKPGAVYTVAGLHSWGPYPALSLREVPNEGVDWLYHFADRFRKINPPTNEERNESIRELNVRKLTPYEAELAEMRVREAAR
jgi:hypothetical protein